jgi:hypothetical protein
VEQKYEYYPGDRVMLDLAGAYEAEQWTGTLGTVEMVQDRPGADPLYHVVLDKPIIKPSLFFGHISPDGLRDSFAPIWLQPAPLREETISAQPLEDIL